jgi:hypothetical protein
MTKLIKADYVALGTICILFIARCFFLGRGYLWFDEILSWNLIHDPSISHMLLALGDQADGVPPFYYLVARAWAEVFSPNPMLLRMLSTVEFCAGFWLLWLTLRQAFTFFPTLLAVAIVAVSDSTIIFESLNIRFYGSLFALICLAVHLGFRLCREERASWRLLAANSLTQAALVLCHPLGGFYGAAIMCGVVLSHFLASPARFRPAIVSSYCVGWLAILLWLRQFMRQADINKPRSWVSVPNIHDLTASLQQGSNFYPLLLFFPLLLLFSSLAGWERFALSEESQKTNANFSSVLRSQLWIALCLIGITPMFWLISRLFPSNSIFIPRYMIGTAIGWTFVCAFLVAYMSDRIVYCRKWVLLASGILVVTIALKPLYGPLLSALRGKPPLDDVVALAGKTDLSFGHLNLPIVCPMITDFAVRRRYAADPGRYFFLLNWQAAVATNAFPGMTVAHKLLSAQKRYSYESNNVMDSSEFLAKYNDFLVLDIPHFDWCALFLKPGQYKVTRLEPDPPLPHHNNGEWPLLLVEKRP